MSAVDLLLHMRAAGFRLDIERDMLMVSPASKLTDELRAEIRAAKPELLALLRPYSLTPAESDAAHAEPWDDAACGRFAASVSLFMRRGINATDADDLAERLHLRDVQGDARHLCMECGRLSGRATAGWRCGKPHAAGLGRDLPADMVLMLQHCAGFAS